MIENIDNKTVAEVVSENIKTADVFKRNGIDFCCGGNVSIQEVCAKKGLDYASIKNDLLTIDEVKSNEHNFNTWKLGFLADYIVNTHHQYVKEAGVMITQYANKVAKVHGHHYTEVVEIDALFADIMAELIPHMQKEEMILFPFVKNLETAYEQNEPFQAPPFGTVQNPVNMMKAEHDEAGVIIKKIAELSNNFTPPAEACNTFKALYAKLEEFQNDLFQHIHLENNILFPKAIQLEEKMK